MFGITERLVDFPDFQSMDGRLGSAVKRFSDVRLVLARALVPINFLLPRHQ